MIRLKSEPSRQTLRLELSADTVSALLEAGHLAVADIRCLDCETRHCMRQLLLEACCRQLRSRHACGGDCDACPAGREETAN